MLRSLIFAATHLVALAVGIATGIYALPVLTEPNPPHESELRTTRTDLLYMGRFQRNLKGSDFLHWSDGEVRILKNRIAHEGRIAPGPDYKLYLAPHFVENKNAFIDIKHLSRRIGDVETFNGFILEVPSDVDVSDYTTVVVWCEAFSQFISAAQYR
jgi:hypothetical protein